MTPAVLLQGVSKKYPVYETPWDRLREALSRGRKRYHREFWALKEINLEIPAGVTLGVLGPNGAGKSTLLQIIAGILEPTEGRTSTRGRVSTLLELGAGFNPDFTGRENSYLSGYLIGFLPREMKAKEKEIAAFAEIGEFIDQPVKSYSTGMYVRLAFAVAINLEPDILLIDEVLAVGDLYFQHKCVRKIREFQERGKTIVFVTHDVESVRSLCHQAVILDYSRIVARGPAGEIANRYMALVDEKEKTSHPAYSAGEQTLSGKGGSVCFDFYQEFDRARKEAPYLETSPELLAPVQFPSASGPLPAIMAHPDSVLTWEVEIEPGSVLSLGAALLPEVWDRVAGPTVFRATIASAEGGEDLWKVSLDPRHRPEDRELKSARIDLEVYSGRRVEISLITSSPRGVPESAWACWVRPRLLRPTAKEEEPASIVKEEVLTRFSRHGRREAEIVKLEIENRRGEASTLFQAGEELTVKVHLRMNSDVEQLVVGNIFRNRLGLNVYGMNTEWFGLPVEDYRKGEEAVVVFRHRVDLADGTYTLNPAASSRLGRNHYRTLDWINNAAIIRVINPQRMEGYVKLPCEVEVNRFGGAIPPPSGSTDRGER